MHAISLVYSIIFATLVGIVTPFYLNGMSPMGGQAPKSFGDDDSFEKRLAKMSMDELITNKETTLKKGKKEVAVKYLEKIVKRCLDHEKAQLYRIELADLYYDLQSFEKSEKHYREFCMLYPGSSQLEYALYRAICSSYAQTRPHDRDQTKTEDTLTFAKEFFTHKNFTTYLDKVHEMVHQCHEKLLESDLYVFNFYMYQGKYASAEQRLKTMQERFAPLIPEAQPKMLELKIELAEAKKDPSIAFDTKLELVNNYTQSSQATKYINDPTIKVAIASSSSNPSTHG